MCLISFMKYVITCPTLLKGQTLEPTKIAGKLSGKMVFGNFSLLTYRIPVRERKDPNFCHGRD